VPRPGPCDRYQIEMGGVLFAYDLLGTRSPGLRLELGETVLWMRASGRVGIVVTDRRLLAVTTSGYTNVNREGR